MKTYSNSIKERWIHPGEEYTIFERQGKGVITHMWFGGAYPHFDTAKIRIYVDGEKVPSINAKMYLFHCMHFASNATFTTSKVGKTGHPSGVYSNYYIPYGDGVRVTLTMDERVTEKQAFWSIVRATEGLPVTLAGVTLPDAARLRLQTLEDYTAQRMEEFDIYNSKKENGALFLTTLSAESVNFNYQESCIRGYFDSDEPQLLSSGLEDYFLGTYYFNRGGYTSDLAGVTHIVPQTQFCGYRFHDTDPVFFEKNFRMTCRVGEMINGDVLHNPQATKYNVYVWAYEW